MRPSPDLPARLRALAARYDPRWLASDPLRWPRAQRGPRDREVTAVVAALLAYGRVASIHRAVGEALARLGTRPGDALAPSRRGRLATRLAGLAHRFTRGADLAWVLASVARAWDQAGSLGAFVAAHARGPQPLRAGLSAWRRAAHDLPAASDPARRRARAFLLADPDAGGACKRSLLLARWCVRPDDGLDLGLWRAPTLRPGDLVLPLDTHVARMVFDLGLASRPTADWRTAVQATEGLRAIDPEDPVRFDFALCRPGLLGLCRHRPLAAVCAPCDLLEVCRHGRRARRDLTSSRRTSDSP